jgi:hypothetical protein
MNNSKLITKLTPKFTVDESKIQIFDIETVVIGKKLYPYAIGILAGDNMKIFYIMDYYKNDFILASEAMIQDFIDHLDNINKNSTLFAHNLGSFDGYFILNKLLSKNPQLLIDEQNSLITIKYKNNKIKTINFKDSYRIFPLSLANLSDIYDVKNKKSDFDHKSVTTNIIINNTNNFKNSLIFYLSNDLRSLQEIILKASKYLLTNYNVSLLDVYSTSSLAMKIFRTKFMNFDIPILPKFYDKILRKSYKGGVVNIIKPFGKNLYYYDVNSLYPWAMKQVMPGQFVKTHYGKNININNFFGFIYAQIIVPKGTKVPFASTRRNSLISPVGKWVDLYFSEEVKKFIEWGYKVTPIVAFEHEKIKPFDSYIDHFYHIKKTTEGGERMINKLMLNGLYGYFGRKLVEQVVEVILQDQVDWFMTRFKTHFIFSLPNSDNFIIKRDIKPSKEYCEEFGINYKELLDSSKEPFKVKSNVAIASAITAYSRIRIHSLIEKSGANLYYIDTDSMIIDKPLSPELISDELGDLKDELKGGVIDLAYFIAPKVYALKINNKIEPIIKAKSIKKGLIKFDHFSDLYAGEIKKYPVTRLFKDLETLSIF